MGVFLVFAILSVICIGVIVAGKIIEYNTNIDGFGFYLGGGLCLGAFALAAILCGIIGGVILSQKQLTYQQYELQYQVISAKLKDSEENYFLLASEINEYNNDILEDRYWADNLWVNWYHKGLIKDLPLIGE